MPGAHKLFLSLMFIFMTDNSNSDNDNTGRTMSMILSGNLIMTAVYIMQMYHECNCHDTNRNLIISIRKTNTSW